MTYNLQTLPVGELLNLYQAIGWELFRRCWFGFIIMFVIIYAWADFATDKMTSRAMRRLFGALRGKKK